MPPFCRPATVFVVALILGAGLPGVARAAAFPPLNQPGSTERHPGKFVWADLFTTDPVAATKFYTGLFGWTASTIAQNGQAYTVFSNDGRAVAGLAPRPAATTKRPSRWIGYLAVTDLPAVLQRATKAGGQIRAEARAFPKRGTQAIIADNEGSAVGLLQSTSGDSPDAEPKPGDWNWFELYVKQPHVATIFYEQVIGYQSAPDFRTERKDDYLLSSGDVARAGVAPLPDREDAKPGWLGVVRVASIDEAVARTVRLGGEVLVAPRAAAFESRFAIIADPTGGTVGLVEYVDNANPANRP